MTDLDTAILAPIETGYDAIGLKTPVARGIATGIVAYAALSYFKPKYLFDTDGNQRYWNVTNTEDPAATMLPLPVVSVLIGAFAALLV